MNTIRLIATATALIALTATVSTTGVRASSLATAPPLGTTATYAVLAGTTVTNTGPTTVNGDLGVSPGTAVTGFGTGQGTVMGTIHAGDAPAAQAQIDLATAYANLVGQSCGTDLSGQDLGGRTLAPGVTCFGTSAQLTGTLTLDGQGDPNAVFVVKIGSMLTTASNAMVILINGAKSSNVFFQVGSSATLGTGTKFVGNILAFTSITLTAGATLNGRALARNGAMTLDTNQVSIPSDPTWASASRLTSTRTGGVTHIRWYSTARVLGFNVYSGPVQVNHRLVTSHTGWYHFNTRHILTRVSVSSISTSR